MGDLLAVMLRPLAVAGRLFLHHVELALHEPGGEPGCDQAEDGSASADPTGDIAPRDGGSENGWHATVTDPSSALKRLPRRGVRSPGPGPRESPQRPLASPSASHPAPARRR